MSQPSPSSDPRRSQDPRHPAHAAQDPAHAPQDPAQRPQADAPRGGLRPNPAVVALGLLLLVLVLALGAFFGVRAYLGAGADGADGAGPAGSGDRPSASLVVALVQV